MYISFTQTFIYINIYSCLPKKAMEHNNNTETPTTDNTANNNIRVVFLPSHVSSMHQPLDVPLFQQFRGLMSSQSLTDLTNEHSESDSDDSSSELSSTESLPDLASFHSEPDSWFTTHTGYFPTSSSDEDSDSLPDLVSNNSDTDSDDSSSSGEENNTTILYVDGYNALTNAHILNIDEVRARPANTNRPTLRIRVRTSAAGNDCNKAEVP